MALMASSVYDAFKDAGASDEKTRKAAEEIAATTTDQRELRWELTILKWMVATDITLTLLGFGSVLGFSFKSVK